MSARTYPIGTTMVPLVLVVNQVGPVSGLTIIARIYRPQDDTQWDFHDNTFKAPASVITPSISMPEASFQPGLYLANWDTSNISGKTEVDIVYTSVFAPDFVEDDQVLFLAPGTISTQDLFVEPVVDTTQNTLTCVFGLRDSTQGLINSQAATIQILDELGNVVLSSNTTSTNGIHRVVFPNVKLVPNRIFLASIVFTVGLNTVPTLQAMRFLGVDT